MRVALLISGFPRTIKFSYPYLKKYVIDSLNPDIFFYGYSDIENGVSKEDVMRRYSPVDYYIREHSQEDEDLIWSEYGTRSVYQNCMFPPLSPTKTISQYYNLLMTNSLKNKYETEKGVHYDVVIRSRTDYYYYRHITQKELKNVKENKIYMPSEWDFSGYTDAFAYGSSRSMNKYCSLFEKCMDYNNKNRVPFSNESLMKHHILSEGMERSVIPSPYWFDLIDFKTNGYKDRLLVNEDIEMVPSRRKFL
jgi:hypothetical protein